MNLRMPVVACALLLSASQFQLFADTPRGIPDVTVVDIAGDWEAAGDLPRQALLISLQGLANKHGANIYIVYPDDHTHAGTKQILDYYRSRHGIDTIRMTSVRRPWNATGPPSRDASSGIPGSSPSLMVSYTVAGLEEALVVTEAHLPLMKRLGLPIVADFRQKFRGKTDAEIFQWAYDQYWPRCSKDYLVYLGEYCRGLKNGPGIRPAVADFAIVHKAFCTDLSARPGAGAEYALGRQDHERNAPLSDMSTDGTPTARTRKKNTSRWCRGMPSSWRRGSPRCRT